MKLALILLACLSCGCAPRDRVDTVSAGVSVERVQQWRHALIGAARLIYAGEAARGRVVVIDTTREMYAAAGGSDQLAAPQIIAPAPATEDNPDVRGVLARAQEAIAEQERR